MSNEWHTEPFKGMYFKDLKQRFNLDKLQAWPDTKWLTNQLCHEEHLTSIKFIENDLCQNDERYYEQIIFEDKVVPTRAQSWHDLFNAFIWSLFPETKRLLNTQHMEDICEHGLTPRTSRRNHITHFDECGVVLAFSNNELPELLAAHEWKAAFIEKRALWGTQVRPFIFGHANYEMLLSPFLGLTGKWLGIKVNESFFNRKLEEQYRYLDNQLAEDVTGGIFSHKGCLKPLPLLGIPEWHCDNGHSGFYDNVDYFRPKRLKQ